MTLWNFATLLLAELNELAAWLEAHGGEAERGRAKELREYVEANRKLLIRWPPGKR